MKKCSGGASAVQGGYSFSGDIRTLSYTSEHQFPSALGAF
jgi:hypothetical protein